MGIYCSEIPYPQCYLTLVHEPRADAEDKTPLESLAIPAAMASFVQGSVAPGECGGLIEGLLHAEKKLNHRKV